MDADQFNELRALSARMQNSGIHDTGTLDSMYPANGSAGSMPIGTNILSGQGPVNFTRPVGLPNGLPTQGSARTPIATLQKDNGVTPDDFVNSSYVYGQDDTELAKAQFARAGSMAPSLLGAQPVRTPTGFDYSNITPIKAPEDLLNNPKFVQLARIDPDRAGALYQSFTGKSFAADLKEKEVQKTAMTKDYEEGIRKGFISGDLRRNPTMGWLERKQTFPSMIPGEPPQERWEPVSSEMQQADKDYNKFSTGYARPPMAAAIDAVPMSHRDLFLQHFYEQKKAGKGDKEAMKAAAGIIATTPNTPAQLAQLGQAPPTPPPASVNANPPPADPAAYQDWATTQAKNGPSFSEMYNTGANKVADYTLRPALNFMMGEGEPARVLKNSVKGVGNLFNSLAIKSGKQNPLYPWMRPTSPEEEQVKQQTPRPITFAPTSYNWPD